MFLMSFSEIVHAKKSAPPYLFSISFICLIFSFERVLSTVSWYIG